MRDDDGKGGASGLDPTHSRVEGDAGRSQDNQPPNRCHRDPVDGTGQLSRTATLPNPRDINSTFHGAFGDASYCGTSYMDTEDAIAGIE